MEGFLKEIEKHAGAQAKALVKHCKAGGLNGWNDLTRSNLADFKDYLVHNVARSSARTYLAALCSLLSRYENDAVLPYAGFRRVLKAKEDRPVRTYLTMDELNDLERVSTRNPNEQFVLYSFLVGAYTGMRVSDLRKVSRENIQNGFLHYVSIKTGVHSTVPCSERVAGYIEWLRENDSAMMLCTYNLIIRRLCERAGINGKVKIRHGGRDSVKRKYECVSSHTARISFVTNLSLLNVPIIDISRMSGHTNVAMTERYIANHEIKLSEQAMTYFR